MNILFVNYGDFTTASLNHIGIFADRLCTWGHDCVVAVPTGKETWSVLARPRFRGELFADLLVRPACFADGRPADIVHAWTPRECVRKFVVAYQKSLAPAARVLLHLEDNEEHLICLHAGDSLERLRSLPATELVRRVPENLPHPVYFRSFPFLADAVTHLTEPLRALAPTTVRTQLLPPGLDAIYLAPPVPDETLRASLKLQPGEKLLVYTGSNTFANEHEIRELHLAVGLLNERGTPVRLVRTGIVPPEFLRSLPAAVQARVCELGFVPKARLPGILALADVLVQPGRPGPLDDLRLPSKLAEFLASGRPVVLPRCNLALLLQDGVEAFFLRGGDAQSIAERCEDVLAEPARAARIGAAGAAFARRYFDPELRSRELLELYLALLGQPPHPIWRDGPARADTADLTATAEVLAGVLADAPAVVGTARPGPGALAADLACLARLAEEDLAGLRRELAACHVRLDEAGRAIPSLTLQLRAMTEARDTLLRQAQALAAAEQRAQQELQHAWREHAGVSARVAELDRALGDSEAALRCVKRSRSWRFTAPLRKLAGFFVSG